ncbi:DNA internalization-related competence protein ComEC/Rec2 [Ideonella oryzae]|uniref:DNA internalization-related competence protein ComEC/Rec2 n=1 Tax=Ideonella oryzae TaxID=2937441 RepID=A0ABT1BIR2_9BURK|nr:DNA internalization-related competence protein ComEC/Rec2 [Ideonella oryzae]MCO5976113.1 DNA internalization-related competence protein ComEC/Rec2 [Ideonella oryzae]
MLSGIGGVLLLSVLAGLSGVALQLAQPALWPAWVDVALLGAAFLTAWPFLRGGRARWACALWAAALLMAGAASTSERARERLAERLPAALEGQELLVQGRVRGLPQAGPEGQMLGFEVEQAWRLDAAAWARGRAEPAEALGLPTLIRLSWPEPAAAADPMGSGRAVPRAGEAWRLPVRLRQPHGLVNPGGFDAELWLFEQGIGAVGTVRGTLPGQAVRLGGPRPWPPLEWLDHLRQRWRDHILLSSPSPQAAGLLAALAVGDQGAIGERDWDLYRRTGVAHLVSISGSHITLFAALAIVLVGRAWRASPALSLRVPAPVAGRWGGLGLATLYALLAGWGVPAQRTVWMLGGAVLLRSLGAPWPGWALCAAAAAGTVAVDPWALLQPGFWLSFLAVLMLLGMEDGSPAAEEDAEGVSRSAWRGLWQALRIQLLITLGLAPLSLVLFGQVSLVGLPANLLAVPWVTWVVTPLALLGTLWPPLWQLAVWAIVPLQAWLQWLGGWPLAAWSGPSAGVGPVVLAVLGGFVLSLPLPWRARACAVLLWLPLLLAPVSRPAPGRFELLAADVGQGSAVLIRTAHHLLIHDAGPRYGSDNDAGRKVLVPLLQTLSERQVDELALSHRDTDHVGGAQAVIDALPVARLRASLVPGHPLLAQVTDTRLCLAGQQWSWDGVDFRVLHPFHVARPDEASNTQSCVIQVRDAQGHSALLTGDIELAQEAALVQRWGDSLHSEVLVVPHHGSHTSSGEAFLAAVAPRVAVMQLGYRNRFGHPHPEIWDRYIQDGIDVVRTDHCGAWLWDGDGASCTRNVRRHYWQWMPEKPVPVAGAVVASPLQVGERE